MSSGQYDLRQNILFEWFTILAISKSILHTLATRHQLMLSYYLEMATIFKPSIETGQISVVSVSILDAAIREAVWNKFEGLDSVSLTSIAYLNGTKYSKGMVLSVGQTCGLPDFGRVLEICVVDGYISFITELFTATLPEEILQQLWSLIRTV